MTTVPDPGRLTPPPPPPPGRPGWPLPWLLAGLALAAVVVVIVVVITGGDDGTLGASSSASAADTTTSSTSDPSTSTHASTSSTSTTAAPSTTTTTTPGPAYSPAELEYFGEIAGRVEYGDGTTQIHRWPTDVRVTVMGDPTPADRAALTRVVDDLNGIIDTVEVTIVDSSPGVELYFVPVTDFASIEPNYVEGNMGFVYIWWDGQGAITSGRVLISTTGLTPEERAHLIREELTQSLGLLNDSHRYPESIFYQGWTTTAQYAPVDRAVIEMLYRPELAPGMSLDEATAILAGLTAG